MGILVPLVIHMHVDLKFNQVLLSLAQMYRICEARKTFLGDDVLVK